MEPFLTQADFDELEQRPLEDRIDALIELERTLQATLEAAASTGDPNDQPAASGPAGDDPGA